MIFKVYYYPINLRHKAPSFSYGEYVPRFKSIQILKSMPSSLSVSHNT